MGDSNIAMILGLCVGIGATLICFIALFLVHRHKRGKSEQAGAAEQDTAEFTDNQNVVVGRPVEAATSGASGAVPSLAPNPAAKATDAVGSKVDGVATGVTNQAV